MKKIKEDIKNQRFEKVYVLYGEEDYLRLAYRKSLFAALTNGDTMNTLCVSEDLPDAKTLKLFTDTIPFFASRRVVLLEDTGLLSLEAGDYAEWIASLPDTAAVIISEQKADKRKSFFKKASSVGYAVEFSLLTREEIGKYVLKCVKEAQKNITRDAYTKLLENLPGCLGSIQNEMSKLLDYLGEAEVIETHHIDEIITPFQDADIFALIGAIAQKKRKSAIENYYNNYDRLDLQRNESPIKLLKRLGTQFQNMLFLKEMKKDGLGEPEILKTIGISSGAFYYLKKYAVGFTRDELLRNLNLIIDMEYKIKTGDMNDQLTVEMLLFTLTE